MNRFFTKGLVLVALVGAMAAYSTKAEAALSMTLTSYNAANVVLGTTGVINDNGAGDSAGGLLGVIVFAGAVGTWDINVDTGQGQPIFPDQPHLDLAYVTTSLTGAAGDYLVIDFTESNAASSGGVSTHIGGTNNGTSTTAYLLVNGVIVDTLGPFAAGGAFAGSSSAAGATSPYSLTQRIVVTRTGTGVVNASGDFEVVPEPATLSLLGLGLAGLAGLRRRRQAN
jgi:hypothetical protein